MWNHISVNVRHLNREFFNPQHQFCLSKWSTWHSHIPRTTPIKRREPATRWFNWFLTPILTFCDRLARQNRCSPPPDFPLPYTYASIVHHLLGLTKHAAAPPR
ncbi:unnamed protein product [Schistocephalus solidus]|uniref:Uncharacterized protein n=1 Tax=Schistocephalus solidus TaxID=70667 RepID=A0A3P7D4V6_SCHSO|nr:unnamed protein product [Schistocephalus solidus]